MNQTDIDSEESDVQCVRTGGGGDEASALAADLECLSRLVDRIRDVRAAFQAACDTYDPSTLDLWVSGASEDDARLFHLMLDFNTRYQLAELDRLTKKKGE